MAADCARLHHLHRLVLDVLPGRVDGTRNPLRHRRRPLHRRLLRPAQHGLSPLRRGLRVHVANLAPRRRHRPEHVPGLLAALLHRRQRGVPRQVRDRADAQFPWLSRAQPGADRRWQLLRRQVGTVSGRPAGDRRVLVGAVSRGGPVLQGPTVGQLRHRRQPGGHLHHPRLGGHWRVELPPRVRRGSRSRRLRQRHQGRRRDPPPVQLVADRVLRGLAGLLTLVRRVVRQLRRRSQGRAAQPAARNDARHRHHGWRHDAADVPVPHGVRE